MMHKRYTKEQCTAAEAQRLAQEIAFGPVVFQVSRLMLKFGIFQLLSGKREGYTLQEISGQTGLTRYAAQVLLEASLTIGTILLEEDRYVLAKAGWFLLNDKMARVNMEFNHDVNYQGLFHLEEALLNDRSCDLLTGVTRREHQQQAHTNQTLFSFHIIHFIGFKYHKCKSSDGK